MEIGSWMRGLRSKVGEMRPAMRTWSLKAPGLPNDKEMTIHAFRK